MITSRRQFLKSLGAALFVPALADLMPAAEPEETVDVSWFRAFSDDAGGPIKAEARFRVNGGEWVKKQIEGIEEYETCTYFPLTARIGVQTPGNWRKDIEGSKAQSGDVGFSVDFKTVPVDDGFTRYSMDFQFDHERHHDAAQGDKLNPYFWQFKG